MRTGWARLRATPAALGVTAVVIGLGAGLGAIVFRELIAGVTLLATGQDDYAATPGAALSWLPGVGRWFLLVVPVVGGLLYGPLVYRYAREARGHGVPEVMLAVSANGGRIRPRVAVVKSLASALCIGTGGSVGREGPIVQIGSALGSSLGNWLRMPARRLPLMVACGAAGGISGTFNAPLAGVLFALEILLLDISALSVTVVAVSSLVAHAVADSVEGSRTFLPLGDFSPGPLSHYVAFGVIGLLGGAVGVGFTRTLYGAEDLADRFWRGPEWLRPAAGGLLLGLVLVALPQMYGVGYPVLGNAVAGGYGVALLLLLLVGKVVATSLTLAIGGSGGVFAPSLFVGAMAGTALGDGAGAAGALGSVGPIGAFGLVGMAAVLAGTTRAPATAVVIVAEITGSWAMIVPLMLAVVLATGVSRLLDPGTIYTLKLRRRGVTLHPPGTPTWAQRTVGEACRADASGLDGAARPVRTGGPGVRWAPALEADRPVLEATEELARAGRPLPVLAADGDRLLGFLHPADVVTGTPEPHADPDDRTEPDPVDPGSEADAEGRCVVELRAPLPAGWAPPDGFARLDGDGTGYPLVVGPRARLDALVARLPDRGEDPS